MLVFLGVDDGGRAVSPQPVPKTRDLLTFLGLDLGPLGRFFLFFCAGVKRIRTNGLFSNMCFKFLKKCVALFGCQVLHYC